jgi:hypothetical protein
MRTGSLLARLDRLPRRAAPASRQCWRHARSVGALTISDLALAGTFGVFWLRERHWPPHQRVRTSSLTPLLIGIFLAQAMGFWLLATKA